MRYPKKCALCLSQLIRSGADNYEYYCPNCKSLTEADYFDHNSAFFYSKLDKYVWIDFKELEITFIIRSNFVVIYKIKNGALLKKAITIDNLKINPLASKKTLMRKAEKLLALSAFR